MKTVHSNEYRQLALKISYYRKLRNMTQEQLAYKIGKNASFIGAIEAPNVDRTISLDTLFDIAKTLNVPPYKFFQFDDK